LDGGGQFARQGSVVKVAGVFGDAFQRARQFGLLQDFAGSIDVAVPLENALGVGELGEVFVFQIFGVFVGEGKAFAGELDGGRDYSVERELALFLFGVNQAGHGAGDADGFVSDDT
jgi:hypothetical protein